MVTCLTEQYFLHKPNAWYSHLTKRSVMIWNAINYWSCCSRLVTTMLVHRQRWKTECSSKSIFLIIQGCECRTWRLGGTKVYVGKAEASTSGYSCANRCTWGVKLFQETCLNLPNTCQNTALHQPLCLTCDRLPSRFWPAGPEQEFLRKSSLHKEVAKS